GGVGVTIRITGDRELTRLEVLRDLDHGLLTTAAAAQLLGLERREVFRLLKAYRTDGPTGLISQQRCRPSSRRKPEALRRAVLAMIRDDQLRRGPQRRSEPPRRDQSNARLFKKAIRLRRRQPDCGVSRYCVSAP